MNTSKRDEDMHTRSLVLNIERGVSSFKGLLSLQYLGHTKATPHPPHTRTCSYSLLPSLPLSLRESHQHTFSIFRPKLSLSELHPGERDVKSVLTDEMWRELFGPDGQLTDSAACIKKVHVYYTAVYKSSYNSVYTHVYCIVCTLKYNTCI